MPYKSEGPRYLFRLTHVFFFFFSAFLLFLTTKLGRLRHINKPTWLQRFMEVVYHMHGSLEQKA